MNRALFRLLFLKSGSSIKREIQIVFAVLFVLIALPVISVVLIANSGVTAVSSALAYLNPVTHLVEIRDPDGTVLTTVNLTTAWPVNGAVTTEFGDPTPYQKHHTGIDIADKTGDQITAFLEGNVITVDNNPDNATGFGKYVLVGHGNGITSYYGHMSQTTAVVGQSVKPGDVLGLEGATGHVTGVHLHFEIRVFNVPVNPRTFLTGDPVR